MSFVNAILACIPLAGGVATHLFSGGAAVMTDVAGEAFAVSGLIESLFGVGKDWCTLITEPAVKRFLRAGSKVLEDETWNDIPDENRYAAATAAASMELTIEELRTRLSHAVQERPVVPSEIGNEKFKDGERKVIYDDDFAEETAPNFDSHGSLFIVPPVAKEEAKGGRYEPEEEGNLLRKKVEKMEKQNRKDNQAMEIRNRIQEKRRIKITRKKKR